MYYYKMNKKQTPRVQLNFEPDVIPEDIPGIINEEVDTETGEENPNFIYDNVPQVVEKPPINKEDIFQDEEVIEEPIVKPKKTIKFKDEDLHDEPPTPKPTKKKRKPMSKEHLAKLALARDKAQLARKAKAEESKRMKQLEKEEKELLKQQKIRKVKKLKEEVNSDEEEEEQQVTKKTIKTKTPSYPVSTITKQDLEDAQLEAIIKYETMRKARKAEKKQNQMVEQQRQQILKKINPAQYGARDTNGRLINRYDSCY